MVSIWYNPKCKTQHYHIRFQRYFTPDRQQTESALLSNTNKNIFNSPKRPDTLNKLSTIVLMHTLRHMHENWTSLWRCLSHLQAEDDGVVLAAMVWGNNEVHRAGLIVLNAQTFTELARAEFNTPGPVPKCLHGWFVSKK